MENRCECAILLYSCWKNSDMWSIFLTLFRKYWPDCMCPVVLLTDKLEDIQKGKGFDDVVILDSSWGNMVLAGIERVKTGYVMLWMDDYLLCDYVRNDDIAYYIEKAKKFHAANIRLLESSIIQSEIYQPDPSFHVYKPGTAYSFSTQVGIWDAKLLRKYICRDWTPWDFERKGSLEVKDFNHPLLAPRAYSFPYEEGVRRGKWMDNGIRICQRNNISLDYKRRKPMSNFELAWIYFKGGLLGLNPTWIVRIQNWLHKNIKRSQK